MYFWKIESLKKEIRNGELTDQKLIPYIVLSVALYSIGVEISGYLPYYSINIWTYILSLLNILIPIAGTIYAYKKNGGSNGTNFASKYFAIGFVLGIRFLLYLIPIIILVIVYLAVVFGEQEETPTTFVEMASLSLWYALLYFKIGKHIGDTTIEQE